MSDWVVSDSGTIGSAGMANNAAIIRTYFHDCGWSISAIAAIVGNMQAFVLRL